MHDFDPVAFGKRRGRPERARHDGEVAFDGDLSLVKSKQGHQGRDVPRRLDLALFSVDSQPHAASL
jgi:hypothetical protein